MKIDLHVHTSERSSCATATETEQMQAALAAGLDIVCITDHARLMPPESLERLNLRYAPLRIFGGIEVTTTEGEDFLVLGVRDSALERTDWNYPKLHAFVRARGGVLVFAHPFRYHATIGLDLERYRPDAIEVYSPNTPPASEADIRLLAGRLGLFLLSDSDSHSSGRLGTYYNISPNGIGSESELITLLKSKQLTLHKP